MAQKIFWKWGEFSMKIILTQPYDHPENTREYIFGEIVEVEEHPNSDFYHIWVKNRLDIIPKNACEPYIPKKKTKNIPKTDKKEPKKAQFPEKKQKNTKKRGAKKNV